MPEPDLGAWLKAARLRAGLTGRQAALAAGVDHARLLDLERGLDRNTGRPTRPRRETLERLAKAYGLGFDVVAEAAGVSLPVPLQDPDLDELATLYRSLGAGDRRLAVALVRALAEARCDFSP